MYDHVCGSLLIYTLITTCKVYIDDVGIGNCEWMVYHTVNYLLNLACIFACGWMKIVFGV